MFDHAEENAEEIAAITAAGAYIMGRKMFGPDRGEWDLDWHGSWGPNPPYHAPTFVLGHRPRPSVAPAPSTSTSPPASSTSCASTSPRWLPAGENASSPGPRESY
jgi:dihydrofolate reductase